MQVTQMDLVALQEHLSCEMLEFPLQVSWFPPILPEIDKAHVQPVIDPVADQLLGWKLES